MARPVPEIIDLDEHRPHVTVQVASGDVHLLPVLLVQDWIAGRQDPRDCPGGAEILQAILADWLAGLEYEE